MMLSESASTIQLHVAIASSFQFAINSSSLLLMNDWCEVHYVHGSENECCLPIVRHRLLTKLIDSNQISVYGVRVMTQRVLGVPIKWFCFRFALRSLHDLLWFSFVYIAHSRCSIALPTRRVCVCVCVTANILERFGLDGVREMQTIGHNMSEMMWATVL